jgi:hypothetical protein
MNLSTEFQLNIDLNTLEILILYRCSVAFISKSQISQFFKKYSKDDRDLAIAHLINKKFIITKALPKLGTSKTPVFYLTTEAGKKWLETYNKNYPK